MNQTIRALMTLAPGQVYHVRRREGLSMNHTLDQVWVDLLQGKAADDYLPFPCDVTRWSVHSTKEQHDLQRLKLYMGSVADVANQVPFTTGPMQDAQATVQRLGNDPKRFAEEVERNEIIRGFIHRLRGGSSQWYRDSGEYGSFTPNNPHFEVQANPVERFLFVYDVEGVNDAFLNTCEHWARENDRILLLADDHHPYDPEYTYDPDYPEDADHPTGRHGIIFYQRRRPRVDNR